jgi:hypothetical protein
MTSHQLSSRRVLPWETAVDLRSKSAKARISDKITNKTGWSVAAVAVS